MLFGKHDENLRKVEKTFGVMTSFRDGDLPKGRRSGLKHAESLLRKVEGIKFVVLKGEDVVRHELVQKIIQIYKEEAERKQ